MPQVAAPSVESINIAMTYIISAVSARKQPRDVAQQAHICLDTFLNSGLTDTVAANEIFRYASMAGMNPELIPRG